MQTGEIIWLAVVALVLLGGLVSLGIGHRRWSIGTVVAGFLVLLASATFLYLGARLAARDRAWMRAIDDYRVRIAKAEDDQDPDAEGTLGPPGGGPQSLARLREKRDRWRRGLDRVETWRGRVWQGASFQPPKDETAAGRVELAADANAEDSPPIGVGSHVFLFDSVPFEDGGVYIGEFLVQATSYDQATKRHVLSVVQTNPRDAYDTKVLARAHDSVTVFEQLPVDRWLAFYRSPPRLDDAAPAQAPLPRTAKEDADRVRELLAAGSSGSPQVDRLVEQFVETFRQHEEDVPKDEWDAALAEAVETPGILWATVAFTKTHPDAAEADAAATTAPRQVFEAGDEAEFDLETAAHLRDKEGVVTIERVFRRRPLTDALTLLHGAKAPAGGADGIGVDGTTTLLRLLREEIAALERANERLAGSRNTATANKQEATKVAEELELDLRGKDAKEAQVKDTHWQRDVEEADKLVAAFKKEIDRTSRALRAAEAAIVARGRELTDLMTRLAREIERGPPPPDRRAATP